MNEFATKLQEYGITSAVFLSYLVKLIAVVHRFLTNAFGQTPQSLYPVIHTIDCWTT